MLLEPVWPRDFMGAKVRFSLKSQNTVFGIVFLKELCLQKRKKSCFNFAPHSNFFINALFITQIKFLHRNIFRSSISKMPSNILTYHCCLLPRDTATHSPLLVIFYHDLPPNQKKKNILTIY